MYCKKERKRKWEKRGRKSYNNREKLRRGSKRREGEGEKEEREGGREEWTEGGSAGGSEREREQENGGRKGREKDRLNSIPRAGRACPPPM
jgi:hypothetical protein